MKERRKHCTNKVQKEIFNSILLVVTKKKGGPSVYRPIGVFGIMEVKEMILNDLI